MISNSRLKIPFGLTLLLLIFLLAGCSSTKKISTVKAPQTLPELPASEIDIPIHIAATPIMQQVEKIVPLTFTSDGWPEFVQPSCDFRYKYRFTRSALHVGCRNNLISIYFSGNYQVGGSKCLCTAGIPMTPWISGACGFPPQPLRKVNMSLQSLLQFLPDYRVRTTTTVTSIQAIDKCQVSAFATDITQLVTDSIRSSLLGFASAMDQTIGGFNFSKYVEQARDSGFRKVAFGNYGYLQLNPASVRIGQLNYAKDSFAISVGMSCHPLFTSDSTNHFPLPAFPALLPTDTRSGVKLYLNLVYDWAFLTRVLRDSLHNRVFEVKGRTLVVKDASVSGSENNEISIRVDFAGSNHGSLLLTGLPKLDSAKQTLELSDIRYSLEGEDLALKIARSLFRNKIRNTIQGKSYLDIAALVNSNRPMVEQHMNRQITTGISSFGKLTDARMIALLATKENLQVQLFITADLAIALSNL